MPKKLILPLIVLLVGIAFRFTDIMWPDVLSDEGLFLFPEVHSHPTLVYFLFMIGEFVFGPSLLVARLTIVLVGIVSLYVFYLIAREYLDVHGALWVAAVASLSPYHIIFARVFELDVTVIFTWLLAIYAFIQVRKEPNFVRIILFFIACVAVTFTKTQACFLHFAILLGLCLEHRHRVWKSTLLWVVLLSMVPFAFYVLAHPGVLATAFHIGGRQASFLMKVAMLFSGAYHHIFLWIAVIVLTLPALYYFRWPVVALCGAGVLVPFVLGTWNEYYMPYYIVFALPIGAFIAKLPWVAQGVCAVLFIWITGYVIGAFPYGYSRDWYQHVYQRELYWNEHVDTLNAVFRKHGVEEFIVFGQSGHQFRWYFEPQVWAGVKMDPENMRGTIMISDQNLRDYFPDAELLYEDHKLQIVQRD